MNDCRAREAEFSRLLIDGVYQDGVLPLPASPRGPGQRALTSFVADYVSAFTYGQPLETRRGVDLMRRVPRACRTATTGEAVACRTAN